MKEEGFKIVEDGDKYWTLLPLYNEWHDKTKFMSVGNTNVPEWDKLVDYCKENKKETCHFFLDLIDAYDKSSTRNDNFVGFFNDIIKICFEDDDQFPKFNGFVGGDFVQKMYVGYVEWYLDGKPKRNWIDKLLKKFK